jgi:hypothetical protein
METGIPDLLAAALRLASANLTSRNVPYGTEGEPSRRGRSRCAPGHAGQHRLQPPRQQKDITPEIGQQHNQ